MILNFDDDKKTTTDEDDIAITSAKFINSPEKQIGKHAADPKPTSVASLYEECAQLVQLTESELEAMRATNSTEETPTSSTSIYDAILRPYTVTTTPAPNTTDDTADETDPPTTMRTTTTTTEASTPSFAEPAIDPNEITELTLEAESNNTGMTKHVAESTTTLPRTVVIKKGSEMVGDSADDTEDECIEPTKKHTILDEDDEIATAVITKDLEDLDDDYYNSDEQLRLQGLTTENFYHLKLPTQSTIEEGTNRQSTVGKISKQKQKPAVHITQSSHGQLKVNTKPAHHHTVVFKPPKESTELHFPVKFHKSTKRHTYSSTGKLATPTLLSPSQRLEQFNDIITVGYDTEKYHQFGSVSSAKDNQALDEICK